MLEFNIKDSKIWEKEVGSTRLEKSGCIDSKITEVKEIISKSSEAKGILIKFESMEGNFHGTIWYQGKDGKDTFGKNILGSACVLSKVTGVDKLKDKEIGVFVNREVDTTTLDDYGNPQINFSLEGFYNIAKKSTLHEMMNSKTPRKYEQMVKKYSDVKEGAKEKTHEEKNIEKYNSQELEDEFPF